MIRARANPAAGFKNCCMLSGHFDGSDRDHFFQVTVLLSNNALEQSVTHRGCSGRAQEIVHARCVRAAGRPLD
jgi:hypothetical protein